MDEKWDFVFENSWLYIYRSWTGNCIYQTRIERHEESYRTIETWVNRNPEQYHASNDGFDLARLSWLIDVFLLGKDTPLPARDNWPHSSI